MRVLVNVPPLDRPGGVANYYQALRGFLPDNIEYFIVGSQADSEGSWNVVARLLKDYYNFFMQLRRGDYDLVHLNPSLGSKAIIRDGIFLLIAKAAHKKAVVFMRGWDCDFEQILRKYFLSVFRFAYCKADAFIVLGAEFRSKLVEMGCTQEYFMETTVVDDTVFSSTTDEPQRDQQAGTSSKLNILALTRIEKAKGVFEVVDTYRLLKDKFPGITLTIAGDGQDLQELVQYVQSLAIKDITFPGFVRNDLKRTTFEDADIYYFPTSFGEGMPNAVLEAMAYGLPVVTRPVGGIRDFFQHGQMGFMTESTDPEEFAPLIEALIKDSGLRHKIGLFNRNYAQDNFRASSVADRLQEIYSKVLDEAETN